MDGLAQPLGRSLYALLISLHALLIRSFKNFAIVFNAPYNFGSGCCFGVHHERSAPSGAQQGEPYDLVLVSFGAGFDASEAHNQHVLWVARSTGRIEKLEMTDRRFSSTAYSCLDLADFRSINGRLRPSQISVKSNCEDEEDDYIHRIEVVSWFGGGVAAHLTDPTAAR